MQNETRQNLLALNRRFYARHADSFSASRRSPWPGWRSLIPYLEPLPRPLNVLDAGCGNGRFGVFLANHLGGSISYRGVDSDPRLIDHAAEDLPRHGLEPRLEVEELSKWIGRARGQTFRLVVLFGVLHHVPGFAARQRLLDALARLTTQDGLLVVTWWMLHESTSFERKVLPWTQAPYIDASDLEPGDHLLGWKGDVETPRYCHFPPPDELESNRSPGGLKTIATLRSDGREGRDNLYCLFKREC